ncbi:hypothetical protein BACT_0453 [Bifidobacterium actinocoloniiforme DSM 22766]|uniref:Hemagglutinin n=1 Tax=Bifidobacterium actinocoloniiforme DSM 22766 TaxID=1437605 RepID=A0A086YZQ3_9BIFI|nr:hemagglutinin [Bifidobacterium actinocoloniiforme]KFI39753.1 hypothetical protein BACT_0453 [Bifidobacterium actinocoloniiforme DSM 22766]
MSTRASSKNSKSKGRGKGGFERLYARWRRQSLARRVETGAAATLAALLVLALVITGLAFLSYQARVSVVRHGQEESNDLYGFNPGLIISDQRFFDTTSMNADDVQAFLDKKGATCTAQTTRSSQPCLKSYKVDVPSKPADDLCDEYQGGKAQSAATIIDGAARSCRISQKVLLTMLQKEQHLVSATAPTPLQYKAAMGLSCPDDADCDPAYAGFFNQVYGAAHRYRYYQAHMDEYQFKPGRINSVRYSPKASCGASDVYIENDATALLYIYTPYQPNQAALKAGVGEGDACSAYGNRNFSVIYQNWFDPPKQSTPSASPKPKPVLREAGRFYRRGR